MFVAIRFPEITCCAKFKLKWPLSNKCCLITLGSHTMYQNCLDLENLFLAANSQSSNLFTCFASQMARLRFIFSYHLMPRPGFEPRLVELHLQQGTFIQRARPTKPPRLSFIKFKIPKKYLRRKSCHVSFACHPDQPEKPRFFADLPARPIFFAPMPSLSTRMKPGVCFINLHRSDH